jgi:probable HAF family extracellular repeat protein
MMGLKSSGCVRGAVVAAVAAGALVGVATSASTTPAHGCQPSIKDLGDPLHGHFSFADAVNFRGTVAGTAMLPSGLGRAVVWRDGRATNLGVVGKYDESFAHGIADNGTVVGEFDFHQTEVAPFNYAHGHMRQLPGLGGDFGYAAAINNRGVIAGTASDASGNPHAVAWTNDGRKVHDLGIADGDASSFGSGLNGANVVVGDTDTASGMSAPPCTTMVASSSCRRARASSGPLRTSTRTVASSVCRSCPTGSSTRWCGIRCKAGGVTWACCPAALSRHLSMSTTTVARPAAGTSRTTPD